MLKQVADANVKAAIKRTYFEQTIWVKYLSVFCSMHKATIFVLFYMAAPLIETFVNNLHKWQITQQRYEKLFQYIKHLRFLCCFLGEITACTASSNT